MPKIAVHLHLFYSNQLDDFLLRLNNLAGLDYDLYVTAIEFTPAIKQKILNFKNDAKIWEVPNYGYDVGPFIDFLHHIDLDKYDYVLKLHTKNNSSRIVKFTDYYLSMVTWREMMLDAILSEQGVQQSLNILNNNPKIGMIGSAHITTDDYTTYSKVKAKAINELHKLCLSVPEDKTFVAGTMFWVRAKLLKPFLIYKLEDFSISDNQIHDLTLAHVMERIFGWSISSQGYKIAKVKIKSFKRQKVATFLRFHLKELVFLFYKKKITKKGYLLIKIFKIPVIHRKVKK